MAEKRDIPKCIADNTLVALTLMIAESRTEEKDVMVKVVVNLINKNNQWGLFVRYGEIVKSSTGFEG